MSEPAPATCEKNLGIIFGLEDKPPFFQAVLTALQHLMSMVISIGTPPLIICRALDMPMDITIYMVNIAFFVSGIGTFVQTTKIGPIGSGLLSIQATSFIFPTAFIALGAAAIKAHPEYSKADIVALMSGATIVGSFVQMGLSRMTGLLNRVFTPLVCGITVTMVGISLLNVAMSNVVGGFSAIGTPGFASLKNLALGGTVLLTILIFNCFKNPALRMSAMIIGFLVGILLAWFWGMLNYEAVAGRVNAVSLIKSLFLVLLIIGSMYLSSRFADVKKKVIITLGCVGVCVLIALALGMFQSQHEIAVPVPFKYGFKFGLSGFVSIALLYVISTVEATGDLSATSMLSKEPTCGPVFVKRLGGGILCDGFASFVAGVFNSFPMAIFAQNNGVIQLTGNASRHVGKIVAVFLFILGIFPVVGVIFNIVPDPVLGGALILLFGIITATGMRIIFTDPVTRRSILVIGISIGVGVGAAFQPDFTIHLPGWLADLLHSPVAAGGLTAIATNLLLPASGEDEIEPPAHPVHPDDCEICEEDKTEKEKA